jgi:hypothetical protein
MLGKKNMKIKLTFWDGCLFCVSLRVGEALDKYWNFPNWIKISIVTIYLVVWIVILIRILLFLFWKLNKFFSSINN